MPFDTDVFHDAIKHWWKTRESSLVKKAQGGTRNENLGGKTMDGFGRTIRDFVVDLGVDPTHVFSGSHLSTAPSILPSYFRPSKNWDVIILSNSRFHSTLHDSKDCPTLFAAVEFKSQNKSIGNNQNNRIEESIGNAHDFWTTYAQMGFERQQPRPWLGYLFVGNYDPNSDNIPVEVKQPHFQAMEAFRTPSSSNSRSYDGPSYAQRYMSFLRQSVGMRLYDAGAFIVSDQTIRDQNPNYRVPIPEFGPKNFLMGLKAQILAHYPGARPGPKTESV